MACDYISGDERASLAGLTPTETQALASRMLQVNDATISTLLERRLKLKRIYNGAALFNVKLPVELLVMIFRMAGPRTGSRASMRLTHVCHAWRSLIHKTPSFWTDFFSLNAKSHPIGRAMRHSTVVLDALARSAPMPVTFHLGGGFLPALRTPAAETHLFRMTGICLHCKIMDDRDIRPFFDLSLPSLELLELRLDCRNAICPVDISSESPSRFPRLRSLKTSCIKFPLAWVGPSLRSLHIRSIDTTATRSHARRTRCCHLPSVSELLKTLQRCPDLESLKLVVCLPGLGRSWHLDPAIAAPRLDRLKELLVGDNPILARSLLECLSIPREASVTVITYLSFDALSECLPIENALQVLPSIHQVKVSACDSENHRLHTVQGFATDADGVSRRRLVVRSDEPKTIFEPEYLDFHRLFRGFAPIFFPATITDLEVTLRVTERRGGQSAGWLWVLRYFPKLAILTVAGANANKDFYSALAEEDVVRELTDLRVVLTGGEGFARADVYEKMVSTLELRASRGLRLRSFVYRLQTKCKRVGHLPCPLPVPYVKRLQAVVAHVIVPLPCYVD
ncbi:hypothetical protein C8T65DRAFT_741705 [Cerioporus squamosus]|nr:hypothetical protein C8T65DRAFT_741705 [Cerioporus squamosus]